MRVLFKAVQNNVRFPPLVRKLHIHEGDSLSLLQKYKVQCSLFGIARSPCEAGAAAKQLGKDKDYIVKAQVLAGGRGKGKFKENGFQGGVQVCSTPEDVEKISEKMIGHTLVTKQTGEEGRPCSSVLVCERFYLRAEKYLSIMMDRESNGPLLIGSRMGGTSVEEIAAKHPEEILRIKLTNGLKDKKDELKQFCKKLGFVDESTNMQACENIENLYKLFVEKDCTLIEINPFALTHDNRVLACDVKINIDDNAQFRQEEVFALRDPTQEDPRERVAAKYDLNYVGLDGNIGCMVNGAGLAMATMDIIQSYGGSPANFLDVGGGANKTQVVEALRILQNDAKVRAIMVNIFGGIMRCDTIGLGIIHASQEIGLTKPLVVRLEGTNQQQAKELLESSGIRIMFCSDFDEAARKVVKMAEIIELAKEGDLDVSFAM